MMTKEPSKRKSLRWLAFVPIAAVILTVGCVQKNTLEGTYSVERMTLMSDNPEEPDLECSEFLGLKTRQFLFSRDGQVRVMDVDNYGIPQQCTYTIDDSGLHIYDSTGVPWLDMTLETRYCDKDSIVLRFVDNDPVRGLEKMLRGLPSYRYRVDTVTISSSGRDADGVPIEVNPHQETDTVFAQVVVHCPLDNDCHWNKGNRLLSASAPSVATFITEYTDEKGHKESLTGTYWEFSGDTLVSGAHDIYDTSRYLNPRLENDRFILEIVLKK